jgi:hypothetical protein
VLLHNPSHAKVLHKLGWLYHHVPGVDTDEEVRTHPIYRDKNRSSG